ncbi:hypothetical protein DPMN_126983 [Dreissena polymorpha]|uniref:Uncharacterized protein n=1 Tax=Dreissena polymorpha TaxID=45954 RepID=A0A9D4JUF5_DREPO|nr:hypothetical protein DPMN_126983 [Dreissena polymorpha]
MQRRSVTENNDNSNICGERGGQLLCHAEVYGECHERQLCNAQINDERGLRKLFKANLCAESN